MIDVGTVPKYTVYSAAKSCKQTSCWFPLECFVHRVVLLFVIVQNLPDYLPLACIVGFVAVIKYIYNLDWFLILWYNGCLYNFIKSRITAGCHFHSCNIICIDFFSHECKKDAEKECNEFRAEVPLSDEFNSTMFEHFCR